MYNPFLGFHGISPHRKLVKWCAKSPNVWLATSSKGQTWRWEPSSLWLWCLTKGWLGRIPWKRFALKASTRFVVSDSRWGKCHAILDTPKWPESSYKNALPLSQSKGCHSPTTESSTLWEAATPCEQKLVALACGGNPIPWPTMDVAVLCQNFRWFFKGLITAASR